MYSLRSNRYPLRPSDRACGAFPRPTSGALAKYRKVGGYSTHPYVMRRCKT